MLVFVIGFSVSIKALKVRHLDQKCRKSTSENSQRNSCVLERAILDYKPATTRALHSRASTSANHDRSMTERVHQQDCDCISSVSNVQEKN